MCYYVPLFNFKFDHKDKIGLKDKWTRLAMVFKVLFRTTMYEEDNKSGDLVKCLEFLRLAAMKMPSLFDRAVNYFKYVLANQKSKGSLVLSSSRWNLKDLVADLFFDYNEKSMQSVQLQVF